MKLHYLLLLIFLSLPAFAAPLTHYDKELLKGLDLNAIEPLTQETFKDLIAQAQAKNTRFALSAVRDASSNHLHFFDAPSLLSVLARSNKFENPANQKPIKSILIYLLPKKVPFCEIYGKTLTHYHPSHGALYLRHKPFLTEEFVGELKEVPHEGFYQYMKRHGIDTTNFAAPSKQYSSTQSEKLKQTLLSEQLRQSIIAEQTRIEAENILLHEAMELIETNNFIEAESLIQKIMRDPHTNTAIKDQAGFLSVIIADRKVIEAMERLNRATSSEVGETIFNIQRSNLSLLKNLIRPNSTLNGNRLNFVRKRYLTYLVKTLSPVSEIKNIALTIIQNSLTSEHERNLVFELIKQNFNKLVRYHNDTEKFRAYRQEFITAFPNGEIV